MFFWFEEAVVLHISVTIAKFSADHVELRKSMNVFAKANISGQ